MRDGIVLTATIWWFIASLMNFSDGVSAVPTSRDASVRRCETQLNFDINEYKNQDASLRNPTPLPAPDTTNYNITIETHIHVVAAGTDPSQGYIPGQQVMDQMNVLSSAFSNMGISFHLASLDYTLNSVWYRAAGPETATETTMKTALRKGGGDVLNIYTVGFKEGAGAGLYGYSTFPIDYSQNKVADGVVILDGSLPGGSAAPYNTGKNLVHQVGHWVGLLHPSTGGCEGPGDFVDDTPAEASPSGDCNPKDTCFGGGPDPIYNYMDGSPESCQSEFTPGQAARAHSQLSIYRSS